MLNYLALGVFLACRLNSKLDLRGIPPMTSLAQDLSDGVRLIQVSYLTIV
jgi:hypothetical protein